LGIVRYGSYVPYFRLTRQAIGGGRGERAVASYDEDSASMAVEASRDALRGGPEPDQILFSSISAPYAEKLNAATLQAALDLPKSVAGIDLGGSTRAGLSAILLGLDLAEAGRTPLVAISDVTLGAPGGARESGGGDAAVAFVMGPDADSGVKVIGRASATEELLDTWRTPEMAFPSQWEERFGANVMSPIVADTMKRALEDAGVAPSDIAKVVLDTTNPRVTRTVLGGAKVAPEQVADDLSSAVGRAGTAHAGLMLAKVLDEASPGDKIAVAVGADGADALVLEVTDKIEAARPRHSVARWLEAKRDDLPYNTYLKWRGILPFEPPRRPDPARPAGPPMQRSEGWKFGFVGGRCTSCGSANLPPQRVCVMCGSVDQMEDEKYADADCKIATYTLDHLAYSLQPPVVAAVVDFEKGGRINCQLTDVDPEQVDIGDEMEMTFRRMHTAGGVHNYFWKARPKR
jgi:3-hydroxy-3-methylglutaryl CoA synthase/uncharacterized OB-fold protein